MNINRDNYEMYFLLYVDRELSVQERREVENFVAQNTDLKTELDLLMQTSFAPEEINFSAKGGLYKKELSAELLQDMLLHLDNELEPLGVKALEADINSNDFLKKEWDILQQAKLDKAEKIIFENKELLYRHQRDRVISMRFIRVAVAAVLIGAGFFIGISLFNSKAGKPDMAVAHQNTPPAKKTSPVSQPSVNPAKENELTKPQPAENIARFERAQKASPVRKNIMVIDAPTNSAEMQVVRRGNNLPKTYFEKINDQNSNKETPRDVSNNVAVLQHKNDNEVLKTAQVNIPENKIKEPLIPVTYNTLSDMPESYAKTAVLDESASENNNHILFLNEEKINRSKLSGFFKRAKRVLSRNTNIQTGNSLKIAGFEVAAR